MLAPCEGTAGAEAGLASVKPSSSSSEAFLDVLDMVVTVETADIGGCDMIG